MRTVIVTGPGQVEVTDIPEPTPNTADLLVQMKACGICGSDQFYIQMGGVPPRQGCTCLGHEPAGEVLWVGDDVEGVRKGDHIVINPLGLPDGVLGSGGAQGGLSEQVVVRSAKRGVNFAVVPPHIPFHVVALNEPMAVALHGVNRTAPQAGDKVVVFGAGPIGLGAVLGYRRKGVAHITVVDIVASRLEKALAVGADAVVNSTEESLEERLVALHGEAKGGIGRSRGIRPGSDIFLDAAGAAAVVKSVFGLAKHGATLGIVGVHKQPIEVDFGRLLTSELTIALSMGYPNEIFEVTDDITENWEKYALIVSDQVPHGEVLDGLKLAATPGAADKVVITF